MKGSSTADIESGRHQAGNIRRDLRPQPSQCQSEEHLEGVVRGDPARVSSVLTGGGVRGFVFKRGKGATGQQPTIQSNEGHYREMK